MSEAGAVGFANGVHCVRTSGDATPFVYCSMLDKPLIQHCEDHNLTAGSEMNEGETSTRLGLIGQPAVDH